MSTFDSKLAELVQTLNAQGKTVLKATLAAVEAFFDGDSEKASRVVRDDKAIDRVDVEIELESIELLAMGETNPYALRSVLTIVKVNNELERIADCAVNIAECIPEDFNSIREMPQTFRVMANSVIGMIRDANRSLQDRNPELARQVLLFDDTVDKFRKGILMDAQSKLAKGIFDVDFAFGLISVTKALERMADHATNICEQVIYLETGQTVRHNPDGWSAPFEPLAGPDGD